MAHTAFKMKLVHLHLPSEENAIMHCKGVQKKKGERNIGTSFMMYQQEDLFYEYRRKDIGSQLQ
jgi:hypothetical protein